MLTLGSGSGSGSGLGLGLGSGEDVLQREVDTADRDAHAKEQVEGVPG